MDAPNAFKARLEAGWADFEKVQQENGEEFRSQLGDPQYWEALYGSFPSDAAVVEGETFDWLADMEVVGLLLADLLARNMTDASNVSVLHVGCGNSYSASRSA